MSILRTIPNSYIRIQTFETNKDLIENKSLIRGLVDSFSLSDLLFIPLPYVVTQIRSESLGMLALQYGIYSSASDTGDVSSVNIDFAQGKDTATVDFLVAGDLANAIITGLRIIFSKIKTKAQRVKIDIITLGGQVLWGYGFESFSRANINDTDADIYTLSLVKWKFNFEDSGNVKIGKVNKEVLRQSG